MTLHYHGTPITPGSVLETLAGRNFCVSYAAPHQVEKCHRIGQSVMLDNGAFTFWKQGVTTSPEWWSRYADWAEPWLDHPTTWAVIPDVIDGTEEENDYLILKWPRHLFKRSAPVWHMHETLERLTRLCVSWDKVCIGSSSVYAEVGSPNWHRRMEETMNHLCGNGPAPVWIHMLRGMDMVDAGYPFASVDSTNVAQNHNRGGESLEARKARALRLAEECDVRQAPARWIQREQLALDAA